jgi:succinyl-CoA synthetase beta subunit
MVIRLDGTNAGQGREILQSVESEKVISSPNMMDAARRAVELAGGGK